MDEKRSARLLLAKRLREQAEHSSEIEMRMSISRMYYAVFHAAAVLTGVTDHGNMPEALNGIEQGLGQPYKRLRDLRSQADYDPAFEKLGITDLQSFRKEMTEAATLFELLKELAGG
ncbi:MAG: hypothetical protein ACYCSN_09300 [Acidobacteriaceae bacterium]